MTRSLLLILTIFSCVGGLAAQQADVASLNSASSTGGFGMKPYPSPFSLLDASRITWSHSYSVSFFSGGNNSGSVGMLSSTMFYELSPRLSLAINLGMLHNTGALWGDGESRAEFLPGFRLDWRPSDKVFMSVSFQRYYGEWPPYYGRGYYHRIGPVRPD